MLSQEMPMLPGRRTREDSSAPQQQVIPVVNQLSPIFVEELTEVINGANGMPVLVVTSSDGRLRPIAVNGVQIVVPANHGVNGSTEKKLQDFRAWMLLVTSLVATVTFTAGLTPPGGFWAADDKANGYIAGTSVMRDKFPWRFSIFQTSNTGAFCLSLMIIATLANNSDNKKFAAFRSYFFPGLVISGFLLLGTSYISGTWESQRRGIMNTAYFVIVLVYISFLRWVVTWYASRRSGEQPPSTNNS